MENVLGWASSLWDDEYRFNFKVEYNKQKFWTAIRRNFIKGSTGTNEIEFTIIDTQNRKIKLRGKISSITGSGSGILWLNGFFEIRFSMIEQEINGEWSAFLNDRIIKPDYRKLIPQDIHEKVINMGQSLFKHSDFTVLTVGWNPNAKATESFQCNFTHFFTKLMNSVKFNRYEFGEYTLVDSDLVTFE